MAFAEDSEKKCGCPQRRYRKTLSRSGPRHWLEANYLNAVAHLPDASERVFDVDGRPQHLTSYVFQEVHRKLKIFRWLDRFEFESFIDMGAGFDRYPNLVRERYGARTYFADFAHSLNLPYGGREDGRLDHAITLDIARLPFPDDSFDVVLSSEVLEHLVRPIEAIGELLRVSRKYLIMTSLEALSVSRWQRLLSHLRVDVRQPHVERNFFLLSELEAIFGRDWRHEHLFFDGALPISDPPLQTSLANIGRAMDAATAHLQTRSAAPWRLPITVGSMGILIVKAQNGARCARRQPTTARWRVGSSSTRRAIRRHSTVWPSRSAAVRRRSPSATGRLPPSCWRSCVAPIAAARWSPTAPGCAVPPVIPASRASMGCRSSIRRTSRKRCREGGCAASATTTGVAFASSPAWPSACAATKPRPARCAAPSGPSTP